MAERRTFIATAKLGTRWLHFVFSEVIRKTKPKWFLKETLAMAVISIVL